MSTSISLDALIERVTAGERLSADEVRDLATTPDILSLGMLADVLRRRLHTTRTTFLRVAECSIDSPALDPALIKAQEVRLTGSPAQLSDALKAIEAVKALGDRTVSALTWPDVERLATGEGIPGVLARLRSAGLDSLNLLPLDGPSDVTSIVDRLASAGFTAMRLAVEKAPAEMRTSLLLQAAELQDRFGCIQTLSPLPMTLATFPADDGLRRCEDGGHRASGSAQHSHDSGGLAPLRTEARAGGPDLRCGRCRRHLAVGRSSRRPTACAARRDPAEHRSRWVRGDRAHRSIHGSRLMALRIGAVGYLNARPLTWALDRDPDRWHVRYDLPSVCARLLQDGEVDLGLVPSIEYLQSDSYRLVPGVGVTSRGAIASVALYTTRPVDQIRHIALDTSSRTSVALIQVLCQHHFHIRPRFVPHGPELAVMTRTSMPAC
jgi:hypothetical protein